jgi:lysine 2,3-aminomutase
LRGFRSAQVAVSGRAHALLRRILRENPEFAAILSTTESIQNAREAVKTWVYGQSSRIPNALAFIDAEQTNRDLFGMLTWPEVAAVRLLDYVDNAERKFSDPNLKGRKVISDPIGRLWLAAHHGGGGATPDFFEDMLHLLRQFAGKEAPGQVNPELVAKWMERYPTGLEEDVIQEHQDNQKRICQVLKTRIEDGTYRKSRYRFPDHTNDEERLSLLESWWSDYRFHLTFAIREPELLNELLDYSLSPATMRVLRNARESGIPTFVNPYYLSLLSVRPQGRLVGADLAIREYVLYSEKLTSEFGSIAAWEKEDIVKPGTPNAAGWLLPSYHSVHRRYPEVAILIPETAGRACGGLCASCQRMYEFQSGHLNFNLDKLLPDETWPKRLRRYMDYFESDAQLRDILITGGDALMSSDESLRRILDAVYQMAQRKKEANRARPDGEKFAEMVRIRLGTRLPVYLPMRVTERLTGILGDFKARATTLGFRQFVIQTHFQSPLEVTPLVAECVRKLTDAGWTVTNQLVLTAAASRKGHTAKLRQVLNDIGVLTYYTFSVKGFMENSSNFATNARAVQEQIEEKSIGTIPDALLPAIKELPLHADDATARIRKIRDQAGIPFLATDRNVLNLPGVGKSLTFRVIGLTRSGRRILQFDHDVTRRHSPIIEKMGFVTIIESKSIAAYLRQLEDFGEKPEEYVGVYGYSIGQTEPIMPIYEYPDYDFNISDELTNFDLGDQD